MTGAVISVKMLLPTGGGAAEKSVREERGFRPVPAEEDPVIVGRTEKS